MRYRVMQRAVYTLIEAGKVPTQANLAKELGVKRQTVWKFMQRQPGFLAWLDAEMRSENQHFLGMLARRAFVLGMQGSVAHSEHCAKLLAGAYARPDPSDPTGGAGGSSACTINILVPRPPAAAGAPVVDAAPLRLPPPDLPVLPGGRS